MSTTYAYPFDNTGQLSSNKLTEENHLLSFYTNDEKTLIPLFAPFYRNSLKVLHIPSGEYLTEGMDFYLGHIFESMQEDQRYSVYGSISFIDIEMIGNVELEYQTIGGPYTIPYDEILTYLSEPFERPQSRVWADVMKYPRDVVPMDPVDSYEEAIEVDPIARSLEAIRVSLVTHYDDLEDKLSEINTELLSLESDVVEWGFLTHDHENGLAHNLTPTQLGAVSLKGTAVDSLKAYNKSLAELISYITTVNINQDHLDAYLPLAGGIMRGRILMTPDSAIIRNSNSTTTVDLSDGTVRINSLGSVVINGNTAGDDSATLMRSGVNRLSVHESDVMPADDSLIYNGYIVLNAGNISGYIPKLTNSKLRIATLDSNYITLSGSGRGENATALFGTVTFPRANVSTKGVVILTDDPSVSSDLIVPSTKAIHALLLTLDGKMDNSVTINGYPLTGDIILTADDIGLGNVDNTSPADKPMHDDFADAVEDLVDGDHTHTIDDFDNLIYADIDVYGFFRYSSDITSTSTDHAATPDVAYRLGVQISSIVDEASKYIPGDALDVTAYGGTSGLPISVTGSFKNNGYSNLEMGKLGMIIEGSYLKYLRNGASYGEIPALYYGYAPIVNDVIGDLTSTSVIYEGGYAGTGRHISKLLNSRDGYMLVASCDSVTGDSEQLHIVKMNGKIEATYHTAIGIDLIPTSGDNRECFDLFLSGSVLYLIVYGDDCMQAELFKMDTDLFGVASTVIMEQVLIDHDFIGGTSGYTEVIRFHAKDMADGENYNEYRTYKADQTYGYTTDRSVWYNAAYRNTVVVDNVLYLYLGGRGYNNNSTIGTSNRIVWHATYIIDLDSRTCRLLDGWPSSLDTIPIVSHTGAVELFGSPDHITIMSTQSTIANYDHAGYGQFLGKYEISVTGLGRAYLYVAIESVSADKLTRINYATRTDTDDMPHQSFIVMSGGGIGHQPIGLHIAYVVHDGEDVLCIIGRTDDNYWATPFNTDEYQTMLESGVYVYRNSWTITSDEFWLALTMVYNQYTGETMSYFPQGYTTCEGTGMSISYDTVDLNEQDIIDAYGAIAASISTTILYDTGVNELGWNGLISVTRMNGGDGSYSGYESLYRAKITNTNDIYTVAEIDLINDSVLFYTGTLANLADMQWQYGGCSIGYNGNNYVVSMPTCHYRVSTGGYYARVLVHEITAEDGGFSDDIVGRRAYNISGTSKPSLIVVGKYVCWCVVDTTYAASVVGTARTADDSITCQSCPIVLSATSDNWTMYFSTDLPYYTGSTEYVISATNLDIAELFPDTHKSNIFYVYATVVGTVAMYILTDTYTDDYGVTTYIGYVTTNEVGISELDIRPALRLGRVQELLDHIADPVAHGGSKTGGELIGLDKVADLPLTYDFNPHVRPEELTYITEGAVLDLKIMMDSRRTVYLSGEVAIAISGGSFLVSDDGFGFDYFDACQGLYTVSSYISTNKNIYNWMCYSSDESEQGWHMFLLDDGDFDNEGSNAYLTGVWFNDDVD